MAKDTTSPLLLELDSKISDMEAMLNKPDFWEKENRKALSTIKEECRTILSGLRDIIIQSDSLDKETTTILSMLQSTLNRQEDLSIHTIKDIFLVMKKNIDSLAEKERYLCKDPKLNNRLCKILCLPKDVPIIPEHTSKASVETAIATYIKTNTGDLKKFLEEGLTNTRSWMKKVIQEDMTDTMRKRYMSLFNEIYTILTYHFKKLVPLSSNKHMKSTKRVLQPKDASRAITPKITRKNTIIKKEAPISPLEEIVIEKIQEIVIQEIKQIDTNDDQIDNNQTHSDDNEVTEQILDSDSIVERSTDIHLLEFVKNKDTGKSFEHLIAKADATLDIDRTNPKYLLIAQEMYTLLLKRYPDNVASINERLAQVALEISVYQVDTDKAIKPISPSVDTPTNKTYRSEDIDPKTGRPRDEISFF